MGAGMIFEVMVKKKKTRRAPLAVRASDGRQPGLFATPLPEPPAAPACDAPAADSDFRCGERAKLFYGAERLDVYLKRVGQAEIVRLAEWLDKLDVTPLMQGYSKQGRKALHPRLMLSLVLYGLSQGQRSLRELEHLARRDLGAQWLCGGECPDHSTLGKFLVRHADELGQLAFGQVLAEVAKHVSVDLRIAAADGTIIAAMTGRFAALKEEALREHAGEVWTQAAYQEDDPHALKRVALAQQALEELEKRQAAAAYKGQDHVAGLRVSPVEPEAVTQRLKNSQDAAPAYKPSILANTQRLILAFAMHPSSETAVLPKLLSDCEEHLGKAPQTLLADAGYHSAAVLQMIVDKGIDALIPSGAPERQGDYNKPRANGKLSKADFTYDEDSDTYTCPAGRILKVLDRATGAKGLAYTRYQVRGGGCEGCPWRGDCQLGKHPRRITRYAHDGIVDLMREVLSQKAARRCYSKRQAAVEPVFGALRQQLRLTRFTRAGTRGATLEFGLTAAAFNLKRGLRLEALRIRLFWWSRQLTRLTRRRAWHRPPPVPASCLAHAIRLPGPPHTAFSPQM